MKKKNISQMQKFFKGKSVLITGGTGSLGNELIDIFLSEFNLKKLVIFSRDELKQSNLNKRVFLKDKKEIMRFFLGDVRDYERLKLATKNIDYIIHAAALKHVDIAEYNPIEFIKTNIDGAKNLINASLENNVKRVIALSTDKAANPINLYGATKLVSDKLFISANNISGGKTTRFAVLRYGNVVSSRGSVIPFFLKLKNEKKKYFPVTDKLMTRFWITLNESANLVLKSFMRMFGGEIFVPKIPSVRIIDIAKVIDPNKKIKLVGLRPGEKLHETLCSKDEFSNTIEFKDHYVIKPTIKFIDKNLDFRINKINEKGKYVKRDFEYTSSNNLNFLKINQLKKYIYKLEGRKY
jgi:UDP-N-acetylglucosamine 4,6-dehydratase